MDFYELLAALILVAPLSITVIVLIISFASTGVKDLLSLIEERKEAPNVPLPTEIYSASEIGRYIEELKKLKNL